MKLQDGGLKSTILLKRDSGTSENLKILKNTSFTKELQTTASGYIRILTAKKFQYQSSSLAKVTKKQEEERQVNYSSLHTSTIKGVLQ